jgi:hypothetical protein
MSALVRRDPKFVAAALNALLAVTVLGIWVIFLFVGNPKNVSPADNLAYALRSAENSSRWFFMLLAALVLTSVALCIGYVSRLANSKCGSLTLLGISAAQAAAAAIFLPWPQAGLFIVPLYWCFLCWRQT